MTKINLFMRILILLVPLIFIAIPGSLAAISNKRLCYDPDCSVPVSLAKTVINYAPKEPELLPFPINVDAKVYSKEAGSRTDLWGVEINGKHGYVPKTFLKEYKILHKRLEHEVPIVQVNGDTDKSKNKTPQPKERIDKLASGKENEDSAASASGLTSAEEIQNILKGATPTFEVIDGTTVHVEQHEPVIQPTAVFKSIEATAVPKRGKTVASSPIVAQRVKESKSNTVDPESVSSKKKDNGALPGFDLKSFMSSSEETTELPEIVGVTTSIPPTDTPTVLKETPENTEVPAVADSGDGVASDRNTNLSDNTVANGDQGTDLSGSSAKDAQPLESTISNSSTNTTIPPSDQIQNDNSKNSTNESELKEKSEDRTPKPTLTTNIVEGSEGVKATESEVSKEESSSKLVDTSEENISTQESVPEQSTQKLVTESSSTAAASHETAAADSSSTGKQDESVSESVSSERKVSTNEEVETIDNETDKEESVSKDSTVSSETKEDSTEKDASELDTDKSISDTKPVSSLQTPQTVSTEEKPDSISNEAANKNSSEGATDVHQTEEKVESSESPSPEVVKADDIQRTNVEIDSSATAESSQSSYQDDDEENDEDTETDSESNAAEESPSESQDSLEEETEIDANDTAVDEGVPESSHIEEGAATNEIDVNTDVNTKEELTYESKSAEVPVEANQLSGNDIEKPISLSSEQLLNSSQESLVPEDFSDFNESRNQNLLNAESSNRNEIDNTVRDDAGHLIDKTLPEYGTDISNEAKVLNDNLSENKAAEEKRSDSIFHDLQVATPNVCTVESECMDSDNILSNPFMQTEENVQNPEGAIISRMSIEHNYWLTLLYLCVTAATMLVFTLGYYYIENMRRDAQLIAKINKLEKELLVSTKECTMLTDNLKATKEKLTCIEDESFGSNEMVLSLKADLEASQAAKAELEEQIAMLEKDLETTTEAGLELERMLREVLFSNNEVNPLAQSVEDLQARLNAQQATNESLTNALNLKTQENEALSAELATVKMRYEQLEVELTQVMANWKVEIESKRNIEQTLTEKVQRLEMQLKEISTEKATLQKELKGREVEMKDLTDVINQLNSNSFDFDKLYEVSHIKAEASELLEERNELKVRLSEVEGAHNLLEEHVKLVKEEIATLSEQCKIAEKDKKEAETKLEVLSKFFKEKEAERQKEEAAWLQKQGEVMSTVERIHTMQNEIQNYKQQIEILKREIVDQEREYKAQISALETKAHEQWVSARQMERRLEESKVEAGQLRNRLTLIEKNMNEVDPDAKLHRLEANGETATSPPLFIGAETSSSPIMFSGSSGVPPPPPPSYMHSIFPPYLPPPLPTTSGVPPYEVGQRPPPLGGRLSSPPPLPMHPPSSRYENAGSPPPPISPHLLPPFNHHRSPPPPFGSDHHMHHPPPPPPGSILPPPPPGTTHPWGEESLPPVRNSGFHPPPQRKERVRNDKDYQQHQREQRVRNDKDSLRSSVESLDKTHHSI